MGPWTLPRVFGCSIYTEGGLLDRLYHIESTVKQVDDGAAEGRLICADAKYVSVQTWAHYFCPFTACPRLLDAAVALELSSQSLLGKITEF